MRPRVQPKRADEKHQQLVDLIHVADFLCLNFGFGLGCEGLQYKLDENASARLGMKIGLAETVGTTVMMGVEELGSMFGSVKKGKPDGVQHSPR